MSRALAYCAFRQREEMALPASGVAAAAVRVMAASELRLLWSEVEWPFASERLQKSALEFHEVVSHLFRQTAVVPFRLLSVFEDERVLAAFAQAHAETFLQDLARLKDCVQMECVVYPAPGRDSADKSSGAAYLRGKAGVLQAQEQHVSSIREGLGPLAREVRIREGKNGVRVFVLVERGKEKEFRTVVEKIAVPESLARRISGPWPATEFLSEAVRAPQVAGAR